MTGMKLYKTAKGIIIAHQDNYFLSPETDWNKFINRPNLYSKVFGELSHLHANPALEAICKTSALTPIGDQEVWASGVTYLRSREARMEESKDAGGGDFYARVYEAERPELFFKAPGHRTVGPHEQVRIRRDSKWNVPEPELTLFICTAGSIEGYTIGNDMSSRDIEGENPLYLPQAKSYDGATALGPCLFVSETPIDPDTKISIVIHRNGETAFTNEISISRMKRKHLELAEYLFREVSFPYGTFLMTGTGIVPPDDFTLRSKDVISISIEHIGTLENIVA
jgi:2-dehydro-3-deoxy-D-arabinonate dehydratase